MSFKITRRKIQLLALSFSFLLPLALARAQDEPLFDQLTKTFKKDYLSIGVLLQAVGDFQLERNLPGKNGFNISNFRLKLSGELDGGFGYNLQASFTLRPAFLDAKMYYRVSSNFVVDVGLFKSPFSKESLTSAANIDFVNRSKVVSALRPGRQIGVQARGSTENKSISYALGIFNGNKYQANGNDNNSFMYVGRVTFFSLASSTSVPSRHLEIGLNAAHSKDKDAVVAGRNFEGKRFLLGGDVRFTSGQVLLSSEAIYGHLQSTTGRTHDPSGYHLTFGYMTTEKSQLLLRWDNFNPDGLTSSSHLLVAGFNFWPTKPTELQVNYIIPTQSGKLKHHQLLVNAQLTF